MRWELATDQQLQIIVNEDKDCPTPLWSGAVIEMINRNLFDGFISDAIRKVVKVDIVERLHKMSFEDFLQIGRTEVFKAIKRFDPSKGKKFTSFVYMIVKHEMIKQLVTLEAEKRDNRKDISYQNENEHGQEYEIFLHDKKTDVEKYVVNKVTIEQLLKRVNKHQRTVLYYHLQGYTFAEISRILGRGNVKSMHQAYTLAIKKMRKGA